MSRSPSSSARARRAVAATEFALIAPLVALLLVGTADLISWIRTFHRLERAASETANIVTQADRLRSGEFAAWFDIAGVIAAPTPVSGPAGATILTGVAHTNGSLQVVWQQRVGDPSFLSGFGAAGGAATLPSGYTLTAGQSVIGAEVMTRASPWFFARRILGDGAGVSLRAYALYRPRSAPLTAIEP